MSNIKNYTEQGGEKTVICGTLEIKSGGSLTFNGVEFSPEDVPAAVTSAAYQAPSTASDVAGLVTDFNTLLSKLITAGLMAAE